MEIKQINDIMEIVNQCKHIELIGLHVYTATQILDTSIFLTTMQNTFKIINHVQNLIETPLRIIDIGGGIGVNPSEGNKLKIEDMSESLKDIVQKYKIQYPNRRMIIESGRYLVATSGYYLCRIQYKKIIDGITYVVIDGGMNHIYNSSFQGKMFRKNPMIDVLHSDDNVIENYETVSIVGPLCTSMDLIGKDIRLPKTECGDIICVRCVGAYGLSSSPVLFLSHELPAEILIYNGENYIIRNRGKTEDILLNQSLGFEPSKYGVE